MLQCTPSECCILKQPVLSGNGCSGGLLCLNFKIMTFTKCCGSVIALYLHYHGVTNQDLPRSMH